METGNKQTWMRFFEKLYCNFTYRNRKIIVDLWSLAKYEKLLIACENLKNHIRSHQSDYLVIKSHTKSINSIKHWKNKTTANRFVDNLAMVLIESIAQKLIEKQLKGKN